MKRLEMVCWYVSLVARINQPHVADIHNMTKYSWGAHVCGRVAWHMGEARRGVSGPCWVMLLRQGSILARTHLDQ